MWLPKYTFLYFCQGPELGKERFIFQKRDRQHSHGSPPSLAAQHATEAMVSLKPQKKKKQTKTPQQPGSWTSEVHAARGFRPGSCGGRPRGLWLRARAAAGARGHFPRSGASQARARASRLAGRPLAPPAARRDPPAPLPAHRRLRALHPRPPPLPPPPPHAARLLHAAAAAAPSARARDAAGRAPDPATSSRGRAAPRRRRARAGAGGLARAG